jgi:hypothetical protein
MVGTDALQAIIYARGALRLLDQVRLLLRFLSFPFPAAWEPGDGFSAGFDSFCAGFDPTQRKLPLEVDYIDVKDSADGW